MKVDVRKVNSTDLEELIMIFRNCWNISYRDLLPLDVRTRMDETSGSRTLERRGTAASR